VGQVGRERQERGSGMNNARAATAWLGTPVCLVALCLVGLFFYVFRE